MGKRKTREQKKIAQLRHKLSSQTHLAVVPETETEKTQKKQFYKLPEHAKRTSETTSSYIFLQKDLSKTFFLSLAILIFQFLLLFLLKTHVMRLPVQY